MSGQKYKRTNFDDDDNTSTGGTPPGVTYDPAIAFKAGASFWQKRSLLEKLLLFLTIALLLTVIILGAIIGSRSGASGGGASGGASKGVTPSSANTTPAPQSKTQGPAVPLLPQKGLRTRCGMVVSVC